MTVNMQNKKNMRLCYSSGFHFKVQLCIVLELSLNTAKQAGRWTAHHVCTLAHALSI